MQIQKDKCFNIKAFRLEVVELKLIIFGSMVTIGFLTGMEYPLAVNLADSSYRAVSSTAGRFYAFDLFGAFLGAILTAVVFIPTIGIKNTLLITMAIKSGSLLLVYMGKKAFQRGFS